MSKITAFLERTGEVHNLLNLIDKVLKAPTRTKPKALTILATTANQFTAEAINPILKALDIPVSGGIFPKIIYKNELLVKGCIVIAWYNEVTVTNYENLEKINTLKDLVSTSHQTQDTTDNGKAEYLIFIDSAVTNIEDKLDILYKKIGFRATFSGGGAGSNSLESPPCIFTNDGLLTNVMQTISTNHKSKVTATHGWQKQSGPHLVTSAHRKNIKTLNYEPIISFYVKHNSLFRNQNLKSTEFSSFFSEYPIGIENLDGELLVREAIRHTENEIEYIGNIPEYSKIHMLAGTSDSAREQVNKELETLKLKEESDTDTTFIFSCMNRDDADHTGSSKEIRMLNKHLPHSKNIVGALSIGEIATGTSRLLHLHNKSIVLTRLSGEL